MDIITICNLKKYYGSGERIVRALDGVNLTVAQGEFIAIVGASGCGKTTLLNMMGGLDRPASGEVIVDGVNLASLKEAQLAVFRRKKAGFIFQNYNLVPDLNVYENVVLPLELDGRRVDKYFVEEILEFLKLEEKKEALPGTLSGGQQQRAAIARAIASKPMIVFADEPTGNLDTRTTYEMMDLITGLAKQNNQTLVIVTHDLELSEYADRIVMLQDGKIEKIEDRTKGKGEGEEGHD